MLFPDYPVKQRHCSKEKIAYWNHLHRDGEPSARQRKADLFKDLLERISDLKIPSAMFVNRYEEIVEFNGVSVSLTTKVERPDWN